MKKKLLLLWSLIIVMFLIPITVKAEGETKLKDNNCVVPFEFYLELEGKEKLVKSGYGILVGGSEEEGLENLIVNSNEVVATEEELQAFYAEQAVEEKDRDRVNQLIRVVVEKDIKVEASIQNTSSSMNMAVLKISTQVFNHDTVRFDIDEGNIKSAQELYILDHECNNHIAYAISETLINGINYIQFDSSVDWEQPGQAMFNENEEFVGMVQNSVDGNHKNALSSKEIAVALKTLGVKIDVVDHTIKPVDKSILISTTDMAEKLDFELYTEETSAVMKEQIANARSVIIRDDVTQEEVDEAYNNLKQAQDQLVIEEKMDTITLVFIIISGVLVLAIIIFIIVMLIRRKIKKNKEKEKADIDSKRATKSDGPYIPNANRKAKEKETVSPGSEYFTRVKNSIESGKLEEPSKSAALSEKLTTLDGFAPSSKAITFNEEDTTVLSVVDEKPAEPAKVYSYLEDKEKGTKIEVNRDKFVIGKSLDADYTVDNKSVSRRHLSVINRDGHNYVYDMSSLNGSFVNGEKIIPETEVEVKDGDVIKLADVELVFHAE